MLLLNICNVLELSELFVCPGGLAKFFSAWGDKKLLVCGLLGGISTQADTMEVVNKLFCASTSIQFGASLDLKKG